MRRCATIVIAVGLSAAVWAQPKPPPETPPSAIFQRALRSYEAGEYYTASSAFHRVVEGETADGPVTTQRAEWWLARSLFHLHLYSPSLAFLERLLKNSTHAFRAPALNWLVALDAKLAAAGIRQRMSHVDAALVAPREFDRTRDEVLVLMAQGYSERGDLRAALSLLKRVAATSVVAPRGRLIEGLLLQRSGRRGEALAALRSALDLADKAPARPGAKDVREQARLALARLALSSGQPESCLREYAQLPAASPHALEVLLLGAWARVQRKETAKALDSLDRLHTSRCSHFYLPEGLVLRAALYLQQGNLERAGDALQAYAARFPRLRAYLERTARSYQDPIDLQAHLVQVQQGGASTEKDAPRMIDIVLEEPALQDQQARLKELDGELALIRKAPPEWKATKTAGVALQDLTLQKSLVQHEIGQRAAKRMLLLAVELGRLGKQIATLEAAARVCRATGGKPGALGVPKLQVTFTPTPQLDQRHPQHILLGSPGVTVVSPCGR
jgi:tetratricopeptide (TPR) repeat protein